jgi:hypothetical protein
MKAITLSLLVLIASNAWGEPRAKDVNVANTPTVKVKSPQFVGFSKDSVQGDVGLVGMHGECSQTYGAGARMCIDVEVFKTPNLQPVPSVPSGWIQPTNQMQKDNQLGHAGTCRGWAISSSNRSGFVLSGARMNILAEEVTYSFGASTYSSARCNQARPVACCM